MPEFEKKPIVGVQIHCHRGSEDKKRNTTVIVYRGDFHAPTMHTYTTSWHWGKVLRDSLRAQGMPEGKQAGNCGGLVHTFACQEAVDWIVCEAAKEIGKAMIELLKEENARAVPGTGYPYTKN
jgi:hypothetical protein